MVMVYIIYLDICFEPTEVHNTEASSYDHWLPAWLDHLISGSQPGTIPMEACHIENPLNKAAWQHHLRDYVPVPRFTQVLATKIDIKSAFCLLPVHPQDSHLLAMSWKEEVYVH